MDDKKEFKIEFAASSCDVIDSSLSFLTFFFFALTEPDSFCSFQHAEPRKRKKEG